jgi:outer membrane protein OmpA-like peptidoglycan-associated protein
MISMKIKHLPSILLLTVLSGLSLSGFSHKSSDYSAALPFVPESSSLFLQSIDPYPGRESATSSKNEFWETTLKANDTTSKALQTYSKFDFIPGEKVIALEDFSEISLGDFPLEWNTNSSAEIVRMGNDPTKWFSMTKDGFFQPEFITDMPENFTIEFDLITRYRSSNILEYSFQLASSKNPSSELAENYVANSFRLGWLGCNEAASFFVLENGETINSNDGLAVKEFICAGENYEIPEKVRISIWRQKTRLRIYANQNKIVDIPKALKTDLDYNVFKFGASYMNFSTRDDLDKFMVSNIRYAVGAADTRSKLLTEGKLVTRGILFDSNSDVIQPGSFGVLKDIASVLNDNPTLRIQIIGHTDSDGEPAANLLLSQKRAAAVKKALSEEFKVDSGMMETDGKGESEPTEPNTTTAGKANNRRVEFIKL